MSESSVGQKFLSLVGVVGAFLVVAVLVVVMKNAVPAPALNEARIKERKAALAEIRDTSTKALGNYEVLDASKKTVRLTVDRAMELTIEEYRNPSAARADLIARAAKANEPPPKAPEQPNKFE